MNTPDRKQLETQRDVCDRNIAALQRLLVQQQRLREVVQTQLAQTTQATQAAPAPQPAPDPPPSPRPARPGVVMLRPSQLTEVRLVSADAAAPPALAHISAQPGTVLCHAHPPIGQHWAIHVPDLRGLVDVCALCWSLSGSHQ